MKRFKHVTALGSVLIILLFALFFSMPSLVARRDGQAAGQGQDQSVELADTGGQVITIGMMQPVEHESLNLIRDGIYEGLAEQGYVDGENIQIDFQNAQGDQNNMKMIADDFVAQDYDILVGIATPAAQALDNAAPEDTPVVMSAIADPIGAGLMEDLEEPGGNVSGVSGDNTAVIGPQIELITEILPEAESVGIIYNTSEQNVLGAVEYAVDQIEANGMTAEVATISSTNDLSQVAEQLASQVDAIWIPNDNTIASAMNALINVTDGHGVPVFPVVDQMVAEGGFATVGINQPEYGYLTADVIVDVINGADLSEYPVVYNEKSDLYINSDKADQLGIEIPDHIASEAIDVSAETETGAATVPTEEVVDIGLLQMMDHPALNDIRQGLYDGLEERGFVDGENIEIDYQNGQGDQNNLKMMTDDFIAGDKDILVGIATPAAQALANGAEGQVPVIMSAVTDPEAAGLVSNMEEPGGNITGVSDFAPIDQQIELIQTLVPEAESLGIIYNSSEVNVAKQVETARQVAQDAGFAVEEASITSTNDLGQVAEELARQVDVIWVPNDNTIAGFMNTLVSITDAYNVPVFPVVDTMVADGGVATYGLNQYQIGLDTAEVLADILEGADPATYPVQFTSKVDLIINSDKLEELGIEVPADIAADAHDVSEEGAE